jgi:5-methylcytosine-specific restriction endonuclease McrA
MQIYFSSCNLEEGFDLLDKERRDDRLIRGQAVSRPSGWALFSSLRGSPIRCWHCGCVADRWVAEKGRRDRHGPPVLNLFSGVKMMTRDHIIPKSLGGVDHVANLRPGCSPCNEARGNEVDPEVTRFAQEHPELIDEERITKGLEGLRRTLEPLVKSRDALQSEIDRLSKPFVDMGYL